MFSLIAAAFEFHFLSDRPTNRSNRLTHALEYLVECRVTVTPFLEDCAALLADVINAPTDITIMLNTILVRLACVKLTAEAASGTAVPILTRHARWTDIQLRLGCPTAAPVVTCLSSLFAIPGWSDRWVESWQHSITQQVTIHYPQKKEDTFHPSHSSYLPFVAQQLPTEYLVIVV